uniref:Neur_chan_LBD domain-containing protein n=1 Tax=Haemonchus contortus TaxID=6289 RepID=A0A7I5E6S4_HAECO|nr:Protein ACR-6 [Haemonchus contortus]
MKLLCIACVLIGVSAFAPIPPPSSETDECVELKNSSKSFLDMSSTERARLEACVYTYLTEMEKKFNHDPNSFHADPPPEPKLVIQVDDVAIRHVQLSPGSSYQFQIYGDIYLSWEDTRLHWDSAEWKVDNFYIHDTHKIWSPNLIDHSICTDITVCASELTDVEIMSEGRAYARLAFRYSAYCTIDYSRFPEDENHCCIFFTAFETDREVKFDVASDRTKKVNRPVAMQNLYDRVKGLSTLADEHSAWVVDEHTVEITHLAGIQSLEVLKVCVHAEKKMSTIRMALKIPITIATLIMLVSPLFGDLRTQVYIKLFILSLQTICFIYLCSISPPNGFSGTRPKLYSYYELIFAMSSFSLLMTLACVALSRVKRTIAPTHRFYLAAKLVNRVVCCIEPDQATSYHRYLEDADNQRTSNEPDATMEWRHVYLAVNNTVSGMFFSLFLLIVLVYWF